MEVIYLDNSATSYPKPKEVYDAVDSMTRRCVNVDRGGYSLAKETGELIQRTRESLASLVRMNKPSNVIFTPSATVALNTVIFGLDWSYGDNIYYTPFEHNSVLRPLYRLRNLQKVNLRMIPVERADFTFNLDALNKELLRHKPKLVVISHGSNVCGVIAPIKEIAELAKDYDAAVLVDAAQTLGTVPIDMVNDNIDYLVFAGHKELYGPIGVGGLIINSSTKLEPFILGGTGTESELEDMPSAYPQRLEAGSLNAPAIAGLAAGVEFVKNNPQILSFELKLLDILLETFSKYPEIKVYVSPDKENRLAIASCTAAGYTPQEFASILDQHFNIAVRAGLHCAPKAHDFLGTAPLGTVRFSIGAFNAEEDMFKVGQALEQVFY